MANLDDFLPAFEQIRFDWLDAPVLIFGPDEVFEYPMHADLLRPFWHKVRRKKRVGLMRPKCRLSRQMVSLWTASPAPDRITDVVKKCYCGPFGRMAGVIAHAGIAKHGETCKRMAGFSIGFTTVRPPIIAADTQFTQAKHRIIAYPSGLWRLP